MRTKILLPRFTISLGNKVISALKKCNQLQNAINFCIIYQQLAAYKNYMTVPLHTDKNYIAGPLHTDKNSMPVPLHTDTNYMTVPL